MTDSHHDSTEEAPHLPSEEPRDAPCEPALTEAQQAAHPEPDPSEEPHVELPEIVSSEEPQAALLEPAPSQESAVPPDSAGTEATAGSVVEVSEEAPDGGSLSPPASQRRRKVRPKPEPEPALHAEIPVAAPSSASAATPSEAAAVAARDDE
ncbi:MAG: hypothetical protein JO161_03620, partial [Planctomycetaceae bacterium]|nr:hypothetical protein [Planctomycetaceae bacterium]